jgi:hypothetical protein
MLSPTALAIASLAIPCTNAAVLSRNSEISGTLSRRIMAAARSLASADVSANGPAVAAELVGVALNGGSNRRRVDDRQHLGQVIADEPAEEQVVAVVQRAELNVLGQVAGLRPAQGAGPS